MTAVDSERQARNLKALLGVAKALASEIKLDNLLQVIVAKAAEVMDVSVVTIKREWRSAKAWLHRELAGSRTE